MKVTTISLEGVGSFSHLPFSSVSEEKARVWAEGHGAFDPRRIQYKPKNVPPFHRPSGGKPKKKAAALVH